MCGGSAPSPPAPAPAPAPPPPAPLPPKAPKGSRRRANAAYSATRSRNSGALQQTGASATIGSSTLLSQVGAGSTGKTLLGA